MEWKDYLIIYCTCVPRGKYAYIDCSQIHSPLLGDKVDYGLYGCRKGPPAYVACSFFHFFAFFHFFSLNFCFASIFSLYFRLLYLRFRFRFLVFRIEVNHVKSYFFFASKRNEIFASISNFASEAKVRAHPRGDTLACGRGGEGGPNSDEGTLHSRYICTFWLKGIPTVMGGNVQALS